MKRPFLVGDRLYLRGLREDDLEGNYLSWLNDEEVCRHNSHHVFPYSKACGEEYIRNCVKSPANLVLAVVLKNSDNHIGNIALQNIDLVHRCAEFAILLGEKESWGKGYSQEAAFLLLQHGFYEMNLNRIYCGTSSENSAMQRLALALGMKEEGRRRKAIFKHGEYHDIVEFGLLVEEFIAGNKLK